MVTGPLRLADFNLGHVLVIVNFTFSTGLKDKWMDLFQKYLISFAYCGYAWFVLLNLDHSFNYNPILFSDLL